jgi:hypothetical protein
MEPAYYNCSSAFINTELQTCNLQGNMPRPAPGLAGGFVKAGRRGLLDAPGQHQDQHNNGDHDEYIHEGVHAFSLQD